MQQLQLHPGRRKKIVGKISLVFILLVALLTFFSKTLDTFLLPQVTTDKVVKGSLQWNSEEDGKLEILNTIKVNSAGDWKITRVNAERGDVVQKGDILATVDISGVMLDIKRYELDILKLENDLDKYKSSYEQAVEDTGKSLENFDKDIAAAAENLKTLKDLYNAGAEIYSKVVDAQKELEKLNEDRYQKQLALEHGKEEYNRSLNEKTTEIELKKLEYAKFNDNMPQDGKITAGVKGTVLTVNISNGMLVIPGQTLFEIAADNMSYRVSWMTGIEAAELFGVGDSANINLYGNETSPGDNGSGTKNGEGEYKNLVRKVEITGKEYDATLKCYRYWADFGMENVRIQNGQQVDVRCLKASAQLDALVPRSALFESANKKYVFLLEKRKGLFGEGYFVRESEVRVIDSNDFYFAVEGGLRVQDQVISNSSKPLSDGDRVKLR